MSVLMARRECVTPVDPGTNRRVVYHVDRGGMVAACSGALLSECAIAPPESIDVALRCHRPACRNRWAASERDENP